MQSDLRNTFPPICTPEERQTLQVMSYNVQVGIKSSHPRHYLTHSWKHVLPYSQRLSNLDRIAPLISGYDIVGLQEVDAGSLRSNFINLTEYLAEKAEFPFWYHQVNRNLGRFAQHSNGFLSTFRPTKVVDIVLPGFIPGRRAIMARYETQNEPLVFFMLHLALGRRARIRQLSYLSELINQYPHVILMGDLNCDLDSVEMNLLFKRTHMHEPIDEKLTFPSWRPQYNFDHILVSKDLDVSDVRVMNHTYSDHLPISMKIKLPKGMLLKKFTN